MVRSDENSVMTWRRDGGVIRSQEAARHTAVEVKSTSWCLHLIAVLHYALDISHGLNAAKQAVL